ncbi:putative nucleotide-binding alpha-beta plait domain superfamily, RNA-binding domain superfamily [Helianthus annuus]|nr:putative nucleotide-binding alpha-beta plait domain superfamily, RNA-binding domain superfamily [Helianthus annuus]
MIGSVSSVRVCRDRFSHKSLGYGYVNFYIPSHVVILLEIEPSCHRRICVDDFWQMWWEWWWSWWGTTQGQN